MATIPLDEKFIGLSASVDTTQKRSELINEQSQAYTMQDIIDTVGGGTAYKVYSALLTQSGTSDPVATILENTLGFTPTWVRTAVGTYATVNAGFTINTIVNGINPWSDGLPVTSNFNYEPKLVFANGGPFFFDVRLGGNLSSSNKIEINTFNALNNKTDGLINIYKLYVEIRVYP